MDKEFASGSLPELDSFPFAPIASGLSPVDDEVSTYLTKDFAVTRIVFCCRVSGVERGETSSETCNLSNEF